MTDGDRERIRLVRRTRRGVEAENRPHHLLYLLLVSPTVPAHALLHTRRRVLGALDPGGRGSDERRAAGLSDEERDAGVGTHERLLERDGVRRVLPYELLHPVEDPLETTLRSLPGARPPAPAVDAPDATIPFVDDAVSACRRPWVDAENPHVRRVGSRPDDCPVGTHGSRFAHPDIRQREHSSSSAS